MDEAEELEEQRFDKDSLKQLLRSLEEKLSNNLNLRDKYAEEPLAFLDSETELLLEIKQLAAITAYPQALPDFVKLEGHVLLAQLLDHKNSDIVVESAKALSEMLDEEQRTEERERELSAILTTLIEGNAL